MDITRDNAQRELGAVDMAGTCSRIQAALAAGGIHHG